MLTSQHDLIADPETYPGGPEPEARRPRRLQVLIADNDRYNLRTASEYFEGTEFDTVTVSSAEAARLVISFSADALDAIVLDGRLIRDRDARDRSGYALAEEMLAQFGHLPPIIIFSRYEDRRHSEGDRDGIIFVSKYVRHEIVDRVREVIQLHRLSRRRRAGPSHPPPPVIILDDQRGAADRLQDKLTEYGIQALTCADMSALAEAAPYLPPAMFVIDLDAGAGAAGAEAIRSLKELRDASGRPFYVAALAGREESKRAAAAAADVFLVKASAEVDALELITRLSLHKMELERAAAARPQTQLALRWYEELIRQLREVRESPAHGLAAPAETVRRALNWPFLEPEEQLVLSSLYTQMLAAGRGGADAGTLDLCIEGASMLADERARDADVRGWLERARRHSAGFTLAWLDEEFFDYEP